MAGNHIQLRCINYLDTLCREIAERCVGSEGNRQATSFFARELSCFGWEPQMYEFDAIDWIGSGAVLKSGEKSYDVRTSPYSPGFCGEGELVSASNFSELETLHAKEKIILLHGEIAREQLMPKNFVFYNPDEHQKIIALLEKLDPKAIICATARNAALAGGVYPFPLIEDGDFNIPSVYMTDKEGERLTLSVGEKVFLESKSKRIQGKGYNVIAKKGNVESERIILTAHIDAKKGTPGAIDNATGVIVLLLLADLLKDYQGNKLIEIVSLNGEDYFAVPGQMNYIAVNRNNFNKMILNINIDGAGYKIGPSAFSVFNLPEQILKITHEVITHYPGIKEGVQWVQGDHSIFIQHGVPAIAVSSKWFIDNIGVQEITHTSNDDTEIVDCSKLVEISHAINTLIRNI
jgi:aminopeptidase YwaD